MNVHESRGGAGRVRLEARVLEAIGEQVLKPENVLYTVDRALETLRVEIGQLRDLGADRTRLAEIDSELEDLIGQVAKLGDLDAYARVIQQLREEKREIELRLRSQVTPIELISSASATTRHRARVRPSCGVRGRTPRHARCAPGATPGAPPDGWS